MNTEVYRSSQKTMLCELSPNEALLQKVGTDRGIPGVRLRPGVRRVGVRVVQ